MMESIKIKIRKKDIEFDFKNYDDDTEHFDLLDAVEDYVVEKYGYSYDNIGENTDFTMSGKNITLELELIGRN